MNLTRSVIGAVLCVAVTWWQPVMAGDFSVNCRHPYVFSDGAVNLVVLSFDYHSSDPKKRGSETADQIPLLLQANGLLQMLRYGSVGSLNFVNPYGSGDPQCTPETILGKLTATPFSTGRLRDGHGLILIWGTLYEEGGELQVQTSMRFLRGGLDESMKLSLPDGQTITVRPSTTTLTFPAQTLTASDLSAIAKTFNDALEVREGPSPTAKLKPYTFYDPWGRNPGYSVLNVKDGWIQVKNVNGLEGWVRADLGGRENPLSRLLPEIEFIGLTAGYLRARTSTEIPNDHMPDRTLEWTRSALQRYLAFCGSDADEVCTAVGCQMTALVGCVQGKGWALSDSLGTRAAELLPNDSEAQRFAAGMALRADAGRGDATARAALVERHLARAAVVSGGGEEPLGDLRTLYSLAQKSPATSGPTRLPNDVAARRLIALEPHRKIPAPGSGPSPSPQRLEPNPAPMAHEQQPVLGEKIFTNLAANGNGEFGHLKFVEETAQLQPESEEFLQMVGSALAPYDKVALEIVLPGGSDQHLWQARANQARSFLLKQPGMKGQKIVVTKLDAPTGHLVLRAQDPDQLRREIEGRNTASDKPRDDHRIN